LTDDVGTRVIAGLMLVAAAGISVFWVTWFRQDHDEEWLPPGYFEHEAPFVFSDSVLAVVLVIAAGLILFEEPVGERLALVAGGMLAFLGILDGAYFWRTGLFAREREGLVNLGVVGGVLLLSLILIVRFL
jgi:hypothetical protein